MLFLPSDLLIQIEQFSKFLVSFKPPHGVDIISIPVLHIRTLSLARWSHVTLQASGSTGFKLGFFWLDFFFFLFYPSNLPPFLVACGKELKYWRESCIQMQCSNLQTALPQADLLVPKIVVNIAQNPFVWKESLSFLPFASQLPSRNAWLPIFGSKGETIERSAPFMFVRTASITWFSIEVVHKEIRL